MTNIKQQTPKNDTGKNAGQQADTEAPKTPEAAVETKVEETIATEKVELTTKAVEQSIEDEPEASAEVANTTEVSEKETGLEIGSASSTVIASSKTDEDLNAGLIKVKISYPKDYSKKKFFEEGSIQHVSEELAEQFEELGIAKRTK